MDRIFLFGGTNYASYNLYSLTEEGELIEDLSADPIIPGSMCIGSFTVLEGKIYAVGRRELDNVWEWRIVAFDGLKW